MFEAHAWFQLSDDSMESNQAAIDAALPQVEAAVAALDEANAATTAARLLARNGTYYVTVLIDSNRRRYEADLLDRLASLIADELPGSYGVIYERDDEGPSPDFLVRRLARGQITVHPDSLLSPIDPSIEGL